MTLPGMEYQPAPGGVRASIDRLIEHLRLQDRLPIELEPTAAQVQKLASALDGAPTAGRGVYAVAQLSAAFSQARMELVSQPAAVEDDEAEYDVVLLPVAALPDAS